MGDTMCRSRRNSTPANYHPRFSFPGSRVRCPTAVFANLLQLISRRPSAEVARHAFVEEVAISDRERRNPRVERLIFICWVLITIKHVAIIWVCHRYPVPFHQLWINFPTWLLGVLATGIYMWRVRKK